MSPCQIIVDETAVSCYDLRVRRIVAFIVLIDRTLYLFSSIALLLFRGSKLFLMQPKH